MTQPPVLVTGATGNVGSRVVALLLEAGVPVRGAASSIDRVRARFGDTVEAVALDFTDPRTWGPAYEGVERMFLIRPPHLGKPTTQMIPSLEAAKAAGVARMVFLSLQGAERSKVVPHASIEAWLRASGIPWTFVRASFFMQNLSTTHAADIRDRDEIMVPAGGGATAFVDAGDVAAVAAQALIHPDQHHDRAWTPTGSEALTYGEVAEILSTTLHRRIRYTRPGVLAYARHAHAALGMPWAMVGVTAAIYTLARLGRAAALTHDVELVTGRPPVTFAEFADQARSSWIP
jgi:uncharacterized protein YbjT (DUF2867 family)